MDKFVKTAVLTTEEMYEADRLTIASGISGPQLMENAGGCVAREIIKRLQPAKTVILCGPGNNGGDGFVIARRLKQKGWMVKVLLLGERKNLKGDCAYHANRWPFDVYPFDLEHLHGAQHIIDCIFGAGLSRDIEGETRAILKYIAQHNYSKIAVDVPSGIDGNTAEVRGFALQADLTITFARPKPAHLLLPGKDYCGELVVSDIGISDDVISSLKTKTSVNDPSLWSEKLKTFKSDQHKYTKGHVVIVAGPMTGASRLAAHNARRVGAGLLTVQAKGTSNLVLKSCEPGLIISSDPIDEHLNDARKNAYLIGPGLGQSETAKEALGQLWQSDKALVVDADGLNLLSKFPNPKRTALTILTPHYGEFKRLFGELEGSKVEKARTAAAQTNSIVICKGPDTVIASPDGRAVINTNAPVHLASAGTGDCLAGLCLGLLCQGNDAFDSACMAVWLHGEAANRIGRGLLAEDLADEIGRILKELS